MLLGLVPECIKVLSKGEHRVLEVWRELPPWAAVVVAEVGETRTAQCPPGGHPGVQSGPDSHQAPPRMRAHGRNRKPPQVVVHPVCPS